MPTIKRYANRKLYDTFMRRYVTLEEIGWMVQNGEDVTVVDHESGADITAVTLTQVIFDQEKRLGAHIPQALFSRLIKARDGSLSALRRSIDSLLDPENYFNGEIQRRLDLLHVEGALTEDEFTRLGALLLDSRFERADDGFPEPGAVNQIDALRAQLEQLEDELKNIKKRKTAV